jgi:hypothetical protein|tara:strand:- start:56 stop:358 length:303 start_codon:yes stop_codon:yes gene_type:complete
MANDITTADALQSLKLGAKWILRGDVLEWLDSEQTEPTQSEIDAEVIRLQAAYDALEYSRLRKAKYDLLNQDEMRYDDVKNSTTTWVDAIDAIKSAHPKP